MQQNEFFSVANTLKAGRWELFKAKLFGQRIEVVDEMGFKVTQVVYKGVIYFIGYEDTKAL